MRLRLIAILALSSACWSQTSPVHEPNVLIIVLDDVGFVDLEDARAAGGTPSIDALAASGRTFLSAYANSLCSPTRQAIHFGKWHTGPLIPTCVDTGLDPAASLTGLAELRPGRPCGLFGKWHLGGDPTDAREWPYAPQAHGWDVWRAGSPSNVAECGGLSYTSWTRADDGQVSVSSDYEPRAVIDAAAAWISAQTGTWLACVNANLAHSPMHQPPAELIPASFVQPAGNRGTYLAMIAAYDTLIGELLAPLDLSETLVVLIGDNGTPAWAIGGLSSGNAKGTVYERGIHVPLIVSGPGINSGTSSSELRHAIDLHATLADAWNVAGTGDGLSLLRAGAHDYVLCGDSREVCARSSGFKLRRNLLTGDEWFWVEPNESQNQIQNPAYAAEVAAHRAWLDGHL